MNDLTSTVAWLVVQVTALLIPAVIGYSIVSRRRPFLSAMVAAMGLGLTLAVTAMAPWIGLVTIGPTSTRTDVAMRTSREVTGEAPSAAIRSEVETTSVHGLSWEAIASRLRTFGHRVNEFSAPHTNGMRIAACVLLGLSALGLIRLGLGLIEVRRCRRRGVEIRDPVLLDQVDSLRAALGICRPVEIREWPAAASAATLGWRRPIVLLPSSWRDWPAAVLRAVLAHELAHVRRSDYALGVVASLTRAIHAYHPLVAWLASRLQLAQEQAADAIAAELSGGTQAYRAVLARMALDQDARRSWWPVRPFSPAKGTLIRRIAMLETKDRMVDRSHSRSGRWLTGVVLATVAAGVVLAPNPLRGGPPSEAVKKAQTPDIPAFDLTYTPADAMGVYAFRPAELVKRGGLGIDESILPPLLGEATGLDVTGPLKSQQPLGPEQIEQITGGLRFGRNRSQDHDLRSFSTMSLVVRTKSPYDWKGLLFALWPDAIEHQCDGKAYLKVKAPLLGKDPCFYLADDRTLVHMQEAALVSILRRQAPSPPTFVQRTEWKEIERDLVAVVMDNSGDRIRSATRRDEAVDRDDEFARFIGLAQRVFFGLTSSEEVSFRLLVSPRDQQDTEKLLGMMDEFRDLAIRNLLVVDNPEDQAPQEMHYRGLLAAIARSAVLDREPFGMRFVNQPSVPGARVKLAELLRLFGQFGL